MVLDMVYTYKKLENWQNLTTISCENLHTHISPLMFNEDNENEMARRFDLWMLETSSRTTNLQAIKDSYISSYENCSGPCFCQQYSSGLCTG